jgi:uncharacterized repeat protein (TIGR01451 family)
MLRSQLSRFSHSQISACIKRACLLALLLGVWGAESAYAGITVTPTTWNVIGLDSNRVTDGPDTFQIGARVCNTGGAAITNVVGNFIWDSSNTFINLSGASTITVKSLAAGACVDLYYPVTVTRNSAAYDTARRYHITVQADNIAPVSTPVPRELYVEHLISQGRNTVTSITGPTSVYVGQTYNYTVNASTATQGYEQLECFLNLSNVVFLVQSISTTYSSPSGGTNNKFYADGCGWENNPLSPNYRSCVGPSNYPGGKAGGTVTTTYTVKILSPGTTTANTLILDFSGSSYHYNADFGPAGFTITASPYDPNVTLQKSVSPTNPSLIIPGADLTYTIGFTNTGNAPAANLVVTDPVPANTEFKLGSALTTLGTTGLTVIIRYSNDNGLSWAYAPVSGAGGAPAGYDRTVTHVRWSFGGNLSPTAPNNAGSVQFVVRIK